MDKAYNPHDIEQRWYQHWETNHYFSPKGEGQPYCIMIPPPNVTGSLHMGHGFQNALMDALIRYHRMCGFDTLWQMGTDHAGIATQMVVERKLQKNGQSRHDLGREKFVDAVWEWKAESGGRIGQQLRRLGSSVDWKRERFTMDEGLSHAVKTVFIRLYEEGLIYRGKRLVNWDPTFHTAISDLEVITQEEQDHLWTLRYRIEDSNDHLLVATARPETIFGDVAIAVNPEDERFQALIGQQVHVPLTDKLIPIVADEYADPEFGTGCVKITPAHDFNDYAVGKRHDLPIINTLNPDATLNEAVPAAYQGLDRFVAREKVVEALKAADLLEKIEDYAHSIPRGDRSGDVIEPYLTDQWFVKTESLAKPAISAIEQGDISFIPENWSKTYFQWMRNLEDWCISRQLWWGHRIPAWYDDAGNIYVGEDEAAVRKQHQLADDVTLTQDDDVLDTWFSSALWPFSTLGWPEQTDAVKHFYPTSVLVTGFDIIFFWVARMVMMGLKFTDDIPFKDIYITGLIRDSEGQKMSKSKGNVLDPIDLIDGIDVESLVEKRTANMMQSHLAEKIAKATRKEFPEGIPSFGADALRFTYCALASTGRDIRFDIGRIGGYSNFCNKLWNAARFVLMNVESYQADSGETELSIADQWIRSRLQTVIADCHQHFKEYRFDRLANCLHDFIWHDYCDWYVELAKPVLYDKTIAPEKLRGTQQTLLAVLETSLRLLHPLMPFITEEIWQKVAPKAGIAGETIMWQPYPEWDKSAVNAEAEAELDWLKHVIVAIRTIRAEVNISPSKQITVLCHKGNKQDQQRLDTHQRYLMALAKLEKLTWLAADETPPMSATGLAGDMELLVPLEGLIDVGAEKARLQKEIDKLEKTLTACTAKLNNKNFVDKAPAAVVEKEKQLQSDLQTSVDKLSAQLKKLG